MNLLSDKDKAVIGIDDVKLSHPIFAVEEITNLGCFGHGGSLGGESMPGSMPECRAKPEPTVDGRNVNP